MVAPDALVRDVHTPLALSIRGHVCAVHVDIGDVTKQFAATRCPQGGSHCVDARHQFDDVPFREASAKVTRRGRIGNQLSTQGIHVGPVCSQTLDILQARAAAQHVVSDVEHVVRLMIGQMHLQQGQRRVDALGQTQLGDQAMHGADASVTHRVGVGAHLVVHFARAEHGPGLGLPMPRSTVAGGHFAFATSIVPAAVMDRYSFHRKGLLRWSDDF